MGNGEPRVDGKHGKYQDNYEQVQPRAQESTASVKLHLNKRTRTCTYAVSHGLSLARIYAVRSRHFEFMLRTTCAKLADSWILVNRREDPRADVIITNL